MKKIFALILATSVSLISSVHIATADHSYDIFQDCEEITQYYDPTLPILGDDEEINTQQQCPEDHHGAFPSEHNSPIDLDEHVETIKTSHQPDTVHRHHFILMSEEELNDFVYHEGQWQYVNKYYGAYFDTFELHLEDDFLDTIDLSTIDCSSLPDGSNCVGSGSLGIDGNGYNMYYDVTYDVTNDTITWNFPGQSKGAAYAKPFIYGNNPTLDALNGHPFDSTIDEERMIEVGITFMTNEMPEEVWSATVTSRALIKDMVAIVPPNTPTESGDWETIEHDANETGESNNYYWTPVGTTTTIWEKPAEEEEEVCDDLLVNHHDPIYEKRLSEFKAKALDQDAGYFDGQITYSVQEGYGLFYTSKPAIYTENTEGEYVEEFDDDEIILVPAGGWCSDPEIDIDISTIPGVIDIVPTSFEDYTTTDVYKSIMDFVQNGTIPTMLDQSNINLDLSYNEIDSITADRKLAFSLDELEIAVDITPDVLENPFGGSTSITVDPGDKVYFYALQPGESVITVDTDCTINRNCTRWFDIEALPRYCDDLLVNHPEPILENRLATFNATSEDQFNGTFNGKITYSIDEEYGRIYLVKPEALPEDADAEQIVEFDPEDVDFTEPEEGWCEDPEINISTDFPTHFPGIAERLDIDIETTIDTNSIDIDLSDISLDGPVITTGLIDFAYQGSTNADDTNIVISDASQVDLATLAEAGYTISGISLPDNDPQTVINIATAIATQGTPAIYEYEAQLLQFPNWLIPQTLVTDPSPIDLSKALQNFTLGDLADLTIDEADYLNPNLADLLIDPSVFDSSQFDVIALALEVDPDDLDPDIYESYQSVTVDPGTEVYIWADAPGENVIRVDTDCTVEEDCTRYFDITAVERICESIEFTCEPSDPIAGDDVTCTIENATDSEGEALPDDTEFSWITTTGCEFPDGGDTYTSTLADGAVTCTGTQTDGTIFATISPASEYYDPVCADEIPVEPAEEEPVCELVQLEENDEGCLDITGDFENHDGEIVVTVECEDGGVSLSGEDGSFTDLLTIPADDVAASENNIPLYCENIEGCTVSVEAVDAESDLCEDAFEFEEEEVEECIDLEIVTPDSPWETDEDDDSQIFEIEVTTNPDEYADELEYVWSTSHGEFENGDEDPNDDIVTDNLTVELNFDEGDEPTVSVYARNAETGEVQPTCLDEITANYEEEEEEEYDEPDIEKFVYPEAAFNDADDDLINIAEPIVTPFVTYMIVTNVEDIDPDDATIEIWDERIGPGGYIASAHPTLQGRLVFKEMAIFVIDEGSSDDERIVYLSENYHEDWSSPSGAYSEFHDKQFTHDYDGDDLDVGELLDEDLDYDDVYDSFEESYDCDEVNEDEDFCIENLDDALEDFGTGEEIVFKNVDQLSGEGKIIIKYEMTNNSLINEATCSSLTESTGCGEPFLNIGRYETDEYDGSDDAEVIVVCPYILTREGGDVFYHENVNIGAEAAFCSEVKGGDGPGIIPTTIEQQEINSTGGDPNQTDANGEGEISAVLSLDTHDICKYSNLDNGIEGYNNVLENFSSTICELQAEVAEEWKETYITQSIQANLYRIARWGATMTGKTLTNENQIQATEHSNGVVVVMGSNLTIGNGSSDYVIGTDTNDHLPEAQTYIIQNGNLVINSNIIYTDINDYSDPTTIPSAAFIVIDGNIEISPDVEQIDAVIMAIDTDPSDGIEKGKINNNGEKSTKQLTINGSLIGNVKDLFTERIFVGSANKDEGAVVIHYQENILLNTPPGLNELVNVEYSLIPN